MIRAVRTPAMICIAKNCGLDFVMFDCEHGCFGMETLHDAYLVANSLGIEGFARVPLPTKDYVSRVLDCGASGIMVPLVETVEQAEALVYHAKYKPVGQRGFSNTAHVGYRSAAHVQMMEDANKKVMTIAQIETVKGVENAEKIAAVDGIDTLLIGPSDLSIALDIPGDVMNPIELDAIRHVAKACRKHGKLFCVHGSPELQSYFLDDLNLIMQLGDTDFLSSGCKNIRSFCDKLEPVK